MRLVLAVLILLGLASGASAAGCYADFKAKRDNPLRLMYGVSEIGGGACTPAAARAQLVPALKRDGWQLLEIVGTFGEDGLEERRDDAGEYFLRY